MKFLRRKRLDAYARMVARLGRKKAFFLIALLHFVPWTAVTTQHMLLYSGRWCSVTSTIEAGRCQPVTNLYATCNYTVSANPAANYFIEPFTCIENYRQSSIDNPVAIKSSCPVYLVTEDTSASVFAEVWRRPDLKDNGYKTSVEATGEFTLFAEMLVKDLPEYGPIAPGRLYLCGFYAEAVFIFTIVNLATGPFTTILGFALDFWTLRLRKDVKFQERVEGLNFYHPWLRRFCNVLKFASPSCGLYFYSTMRKDSILMLYLLCRAINAFVSIDWLLCFGIVKADDSYAPQHIEIRKYVVEARQKQREIIVADAKL